MPRKLFVERVEGADGGLISPCGFKRGDYNDLLRVQATKPVLCGVVLNLRDGVFEIRRSTKPHEITRKV